MAELIVKIRNEVEGVTIPDVFFDMLYPPAGEPPSQELGPDRFLKALIVTMALQYYARSGTDLIDAIEYVETEVQRTT